MPNDWRVASIAELTKPKKESNMFNANVKVMFKVNGYEFKVRNTIETNKQVSLHDRKE